MVPIQTKSKFHGVEAIEELGSKLMEHATKVLGRMVDERLREVRKRNNIIWIVR